MNLFFTQARLSARALVPFLLLIFTLFSQFATAQATVTYSTEALPAGNIPQDATKLIYVMKVVVNSNLPVIISSVSIKTSGNYTRPDVSKFVLLHGLDPSIENANFVGERPISDGGGEKVTWDSREGENKTIRLAANSTNYFFIQVTTSRTATGGRTIGISGIGNDLFVRYVSLDPDPVSIDNQSDKASLQTILAPSITYSTEPVTGGNAAAGTTGNLVYILKVEGGNVASAMFDNVFIKTTGTYSESDIENFGIYRNTSASMSGATFLGFDENLTGAGETLNFMVPTQIISANETRYYLVVATVSNMGNDGRTFGINGAGNALNISYINNPTITNNQTDIAELKTIIGPPIVVSTRPYPAENAVLGTSGHVLYIFQISTNPYVDVTISDIRLRITGTYTASDISSFRLLRSQISTMDPASIESLVPGSVVTGNGELMSFSGLQILPRNTTTFFGVVADVALNATPGRTFGVDGSNNDLAISFNRNSPIPSVVNNQTNISGMQTVLADVITYSTVPIAAKNVSQGASLHPVYIFKVKNANALASASTVTIKTTGTYSGSDISSFRLLRGNDPSMALPTIEAATGFVTATGGGETLTFSMPTTLQPNATKYYGIMAYVSPGATTGRTFGIDGSANALGIDFSSPTPNLKILDSQTNVAGLQTIGVSGITYSTEPLPAGTVALGSVDQPIYTLKVAVNGDAGATLTNLETTTSGTYQAGDVSSFSLYLSDTPSFNDGAENGRVLNTPIATIDASAGAGETLRFGTGQISLPAAGNTYLIITANISASGTNSNTVHINGNSSPATLRFSGAAPSPVRNNQSNAAGVQTIDNGLPVTLVSFKAKSEGDVRQLVWETSMEKGNDYFEIQRSSNAINFAAIGQIKGSAAGFETHYYNFTDSEAMSASNVYYRLKMVDLDQTFAYSRIASVQMKGLDNTLVYPNPSSDILYLNVTDWAAVSMVRLFDLNGKVFYQSDKIPAKTIAVKKIPAGAYVVSITDQSGNTTSQRVLLVR